MFRKYSFALIALVTAATPIALATSASAIPIDIAINGPKNFPKPWPKPWPHPHWHPDPVIVVERPYVQPMISQPVVRNVTRVVSQPAQQTQAPATNCLTKQYSPNGIVTFTDLCTKETASAVLPGSAAAMQQQQQTAPQVAPQGLAPQGAAPVTQNLTTNVPQSAVK